jgi:antibiotic biosynthesis monooxygenase (ABM) superfamily enzyme
VKWITENNRPVMIIEDMELQELLLAGQPQLTLPSRHTLSRDIHASYERCHERITKLLQDHPGRLHFATDCWTSPNHQAFVAWMVHLAF